MARKAGIIGGGVIGGGWAARFLLNGWDVGVFDPEGSDERNLSYRFVYRHPERTLKDKDVEKVNNRIGQHLVQKLPVRFS